MAWGWAHCLCPTWWALGLVCFYLPAEGLGKHSEIAQETFVE